MLKNKSVNTTNFISKYLALTILELMVVVAIIGILGTIGAPSYRKYVIRTKISKLINSSSIYKREVEEIKNKGTLLGITNSTIIIPSSDTSKPSEIDSIERIEYGCVKINFDTYNLGLDSSESLSLIWCPSIINGISKWICGYDPTNTRDYHEYIPSNCINDYTTIIDTSY